MIKYREWVQSTNQGYSDPTEWNGNNRSCDLCDKDAEMDDKYCEDHQHCSLCGYNDEDCQTCDSEYNNDKTEEYYGR